MAATTEIDAATVKSSDMAHLSAEQVSQLIGLIYQGLLEPVPWTGILRWLNTAFKASWSVLVLRPAARGRASLIIQANYQEVAVSSADYTLFDIYSADPFANLPHNHIITPEEFLGEAQWFGSDFFVNYLQQTHDIRYEIGADFRSDDHSECRFRMCKPPASGPFTEAEKNLCALLLPHFQRAVYLHSRMYTAEVEKKLFQSTFDRMHIGTIILDETGAPLTTNNVADAILVKKSDLWLGSNGVHARQYTAEQQLQNAIELALAATDEPSITALALPRTHGVGNWKILVKSIPRAPLVEGNHRPTVAIFIHDPDYKSAPPVDILRMLFNFTPAEANFAKLLAEGLTLDEAGEQLGITKNTVKSRLRSIFAKTGATRQSSLIRILLDTMVSL